MSFLYFYFFSVHDKTSDQTPQMNGVAHNTTNVSSSNGPPKAMVKPHVLTHVIEGFVIHEGEF